MCIRDSLIGEQIADSPFGELFDGRHAYQLSLKLAKAYQKTAQKFHCHFLNAAEYAQPSAKDCLHLDSAGHAASVSYTHLDFFTKVYSGMFFKHGKMFPNMVDFL